MSVLAALQALSASGAFASRAFLPLFLVGLVARWPQLVSWLPFVPDHPVVLSARLEWIASPWCLVALAALTLLEARAERDPDARQILQEIDAPLKGAVACLTAFALVDSESAAILRNIAGMPVSAAGLWAPDARTLVALAFALGVGALTFGLAWWRSLVLREARDIADDLGLTTPVAWLEEAWSASGMLLAILAPVVALIGALLAIGLLRLTQAALERAADRTRVPCGACGAACLPAASACPSCGRDVVPRSSGAGAGWPDRWIEGDAAHLRATELLGRGRCPACAERRDAADVLALTPHACGWPARRGPGADWPALLLAAVSRRTGMLVLSAGILGLFPVAGTVAALVLSRARIAAPLRRYLPLGARLRARWTVRLIGFPLLLGSGIPGLSAFCAAGLVALSSLVWTRAFRAAVPGSLTPAESPAPPAEGSPARSSS